MNRARRGRMLARVQWYGALTAVAATLAMLAVPGVARAEGPGSDPVTGGGGNSAITVSWTQGLLDNTNTPITAASADPLRASNSTSPLSFMDGDFKNLTVTVGQTANIGHQGITVSWTGGVPTIGTNQVAANYLQMMECYGDASTGPTPEQCEYGSQGLVQNAGLGGRTGELCVAGAVPSITKPPPGLSGDGAAFGCDPEEPSDPTHLNPCPAGSTSCDTTDYNIPFAPVGDPTNLDYKSNSTTYFSTFNTDEVQAAPTNSQGNGQQQFETVTGVQSSGLGCGMADNNQPRGCWLVIVPRGQYDANGFKYSNSLFDSLRSSPLSAANWAQRIQIHLGFAPVGNFCPITSQELQTIGTQVITRAMQSWQLALNQAANCSEVFGYSETPENETSIQLASATSQIGLAFTTIPIGSEAARSGGSPPPGLPKFLYAPVAVTALGFGFNINRSSGYDFTPVKLTPLLMAKALTQSFRQDLPDGYNIGNVQPPAWAAANPVNISADNTFQQLNSSAAPLFGGPINPQLTEDHSALNQQLWQWIQGSGAARTWLGGTPDASDGNMAVDPDYKTLKLDQAPASDWFPRAYSGELQLTEPVGNPPVATVVKKGSLDLLPYAKDFDQASSWVLAGDNTAFNGPWDTGKLSPSGTAGWWDQAGVEQFGNIFMWAFSDMPDMTAYGLIPAQLCDDSGANCVSPTSSSLTTAVASASKDSAGLLEVNPASPGSGGWPLTQVVYAAVPTNQPAAVLNQDASLISYAIGAGQTPGSNPGNLPPGYLPLPSSMQADAQSVITQLKGLASPSPTPSPTPSASSSSPTPAASTSSAAVLGGNGSSTPASTTSASTTGTGTTGAGTTGSGSTGGATGGSTAPAGGTTAGATAPAPAPGGSLPASGAHSTPATGSTTSVPGGPVISLAGNRNPPQATGGTPVGAIRWVLVTLIIAGGSCAITGTILRSRFSPAWLSWPPRGKPR